ncbi:protein CURVATURE THYLAKOID 1D, chloroplastic [Cornus florida]|uniref:protein CURVATURE THYLAKOID 1D, chloroplastic n=1 Tax=Cornus florida TaxID=4283 RepID=UPI00289A661D|nr:protein CURVATURE THYLAKOID 1D, chloroplastic [Cornus florida]
MELCTARTFSNLPRHTLFSANQTRLRWKTSLPINKNSSIPPINRGLIYYTKSSLKPTTSEETSTEASQYVEIEPTENNAYDEMKKEAPKEDYPMDGQTLSFDFLDKLDIKLDSKDSYSYIILGGGALASLWLVTAVVGAIDSIPVFPKLMEVVGLAYTLWFTSRYLIFKENREELAAKIEEIKLQVLGSSGD